MLDTSLDIEFIEMCEETKVLNVAFVSSTTKIIIFAKVKSSAVSSVRFVQFWKTSILYPDKKVTINNPSENLIYDRVSIDLGATLLFSSLYFSGIPQIHGIFINFDYLKLKLLVRTDQ